MSVSPEVEIPDNVKGKLAWLLILFPGALSLGLFQYITDVRNLSEAELIMGAFAFSFVSVILAMPTYWLIAWIFRGRKPNWAKDVWQFEIRRYIGFFVWVVFFSMGIGWVAAIVYENDVLFRAARSTSLFYTQKSSSQRPLTLLLTLNSEGALYEAEGRPDELPKEPSRESYIQIHLTKGQIFEGHPGYFSGDEKTGEIFLTPACEGTLRNGRIEFAPVPGPGVLVFERNIKFIKFVDKQLESKCFALWNKLRSEAKPAKVDAGKSKPTTPSASSTPGAG